MSGVDCSVYPRVIERAYPMLPKRKLAKALVALIALCLAINMLTGGVFWGLNVVSFGVFIWACFFRRILVEHSRIQRLLDVSCAFNLFLCTLDFTTGRTGWAGSVVIPLNSCALLAAAFLSFELRMKRGLAVTVMPCISMCAVAFGTFVLGLLGFRRLAWPMLVQVLFAAVGLLLLLVRYNELFLAELRKKWRA